MQIDFVAQEIERRKSKDDMVKILLLLDDCYGNIIRYMCMYVHSFHNQSLNLSLQIFVLGEVGPLASDISIAGVAKAFGVRLVFISYAFCIRS